VPLIKPSFLKELSPVENAEYLSYCYNCGACVGDCPAARYNPAFNPRKIVQLTLLGLTESLLKEDSVLFACTTCFTCYERCPQSVRPIEVITALKNFLFSKGHCPKEILEVSKNVLKTGRAVLVSAATNSRRQKFRLGESPIVSIEELKKILG